MRFSRRIRNVGTATVRQAVEMILGQLGLIQDETERAVSELERRLAELEATANEGQV